MFISRKIAKLHQHLSTTLTKPADLAPSKTDKKKERRCQYKDIPSHQRYIQNDLVYPVYGDFVFIERNGDLITDLSLLNTSKIVQNVVVNELYNQQMVTVQLTPKVNKELPTWMEFVDYLNKSGKPGIQGWGKLIKQFCHTYSKVMRRQTRKKMKTEPRKRFFAEVTGKTELQKKAVFDLYPCLYLKFRLKNHENQLKELIYSEKFIKLLGHCSESFVSTVFNEGIPRLMSDNNPLAESVIKPLIENYFTITDNGSEVQELETMIICRDSFVRNVRFKAFYFMNYEKNTFGTDVILAITAIGEPYLYPQNIPRLQFDAEFIENMAVKEDEMSYFLAVYYDQRTEKTYANMDKTCLFREI